jgi:uncharacterized protein
MRAPVELSASTTAQRAAVLALNQRYQSEMSSLTQGGLDQLVAASVYARTVGDLDGFLIAFDQSSNYAGENFSWFKTRFQHFVYVDRIAIAPVAQGRGSARALYTDLFGWARAHGHTLVTCEVNIDPPNDASARLHGEIGFRQIDQGIVGGGTKTVAYLARHVGEIIA